MLNAHFLVQALHIAATLRIARIVDVGGGQGATLVSILQTHPHVTGVLFDLPHVLTNTLVPESLAERCEIAAGDMLQSVPAGEDASCSSEGARRL